MKKTRNLKNEKGITLIALIVMIIILIILSAVVIKGVTGDNLINTTLLTEDEYTIKSYKEQVNAAARSIILKNTARGRDTSITGITEEMNKTETSWISKAEEVNEYMIVTVENKCAYQVYYDPAYEVLFTEYIGRDDEKGFPSLNMRYDRAKIIGQVKAESGETIEKVELIYRGVVKQKQDKPSENIEFNAEETGTGWYIIKATSSSGKTIYNWIRVRST